MEHLDHPSPHDAFLLLRAFLIALGERGKLFLFILSKIVGVLIGTGCCEDSLTMDHHHDLILRLRCILK